jgi:PAS domain S-box-containing protein
MLILGDAPRVVFVVPVGAPARTLGAVVLVADPEAWLYPFLRHETAFSHTAETLLWRREGEDLVCVSPARGGGAPPFGIRRPADRPGLAAASAGQEAFASLRDHHGVPVLAATRRLRLASWTLVVKIDRAEVLTDWRRTLGAAATVLLASLLAFGGLAYGLWQRRALQERRVAQAALVESEERFRRLAEQAPDLVFRYRLRPTRAFEYVSPAALAMTGYSPEEHYADPDLGLKLVHPEDRHLVEAILGGAVEAPHPLVLRWVRRDGSVVWTEHRTVVVRSPSGEVLAVEGIARDISETVTAERALRHSESRYRLLFEASPLPMWVYDRETLRFLAVNQAAIAHYGYDLDEFLAMSVEQIRPPEDVPALHAHLAAQHANGAAGVWRHRRRDGSLISVEIHSHAIEFDGRPARLVLVSDVTDRLAAEATARKLTRAVEQSPASVVITDPQGSIEYVNPRFTEVSGYTREEVMGRNPRLLKSGQTAPEVYRAMWSTLLGGSEWRGELHNRKKNGELYWELASISPLLDPQGRITHYLAVKEDITAAKQAQEALRAAQGQLQQAQKMEAVGRLAGGVAHDFNNLLTVINGYGELLALSLPAEHPERPRVDAILGAGRRAADLTRQLLAFSRRAPLQPRLVDLNAVLAGVEPMLRRLIGEDIELVVERGEGLGTVQADPGQIEQVIMNLAVNARDAMPRGGSLTLSAANAQPPARGIAGERPAAAGHVLLTVSDTGVGMSDEVLSHLYEPFFTTKAPGQGTGLGLATVYGIVRQSGGDIAVDSRPGQGTTFRIWLPRVDLPAEECSARLQAGRELRGSETVLLVEDQEAVRRLAQAMLVDLGYRVLEAPSAAAALELARRHSGAIHLLLTDVVMPQMGGRELAVMLRALRPGIRVLFMSGYTEDVIARHGELEARARLLEKPFTFEALGREVRAALESRNDA